MAEGRAGGPGPAVFVIGCLTIDSVISAARARFARVCGGNGLYAAIGAGIWDDTVGLVTRAGSDYPEHCLQEMAQRFDASGVVRLPAPHELVVAFAYRDDGSRTRHVPAELLDAVPAGERPAFFDTTGDDARYLRFTPDAADVPGAWLRSAVAVHLPALLVRSHERLVAALRDARPDLLITLDSPWYDRHDPTGLAHIGLLRDVDVVLPSEEDLALAFPRMPVLDAAHALRGLGARTVVVKLAAAGSLVVDDNGVTHVPAFPSHVVDPTGAGDSFCGGFLAGLRETRDPVRAAQFGTASASFVVEHAEALAVRAVDRRAAEQRLAAIADRVVQGVTRDPREMAA